MGLLIGFVFSIDRLIQLNILLKCYSYITMLANLYIAYPINILIHTQCHTHIKRYVECIKYVDILFGNIYICIYIYIYTHTHTHNIKNQRICHHHHQTIICLHTKLQGLNVLNLYKMKLKK